MSNLLVKQLTEKECSSSEIEQLLSLLGQLSSSSTITSETVIKAIQNPHLTLLVATCDDRIVGTASMIVASCLTGTRAHLEDVVVDKEFRGKGIATLLVHDIIDRARKTSARTLDLTSRPDRVAANGLYQKLKFIKRDTNVYRLTL
ncbi:MAG: GCN5-like N-acetyltransferase [Benjaminiella poitrasii]|nr:MAG: GCN5-like N-acetyltransferase [Benjaminiella poitrasii]